MDFVRGSINVYDIFVNPDGERTIAVITERTKTQNNIKPPPSRVRRGARRHRSRRPPHPRLRRRPARRPFPGMGGRQNVKTTESDRGIQENRRPQPRPGHIRADIDPRRMVVGTLSLPYKAQVEEFRRALRAKDANSLSEYPEYRGFVVERRMLSLDGKTVERDWTVLDIQTALGDLFSRVVEFEPENPPRSMDQKLQRSTRGSSPMIRTSCSSPARGCIRAIIRPSTCRP